MSRVCHIAHTTNAAATTDGQATMLFHFPRINNNDGSMAARLVVAQIAFSRGGKMSAPKKIIQRQLSVIQSSEITQHTPLKMTTTPLSTQSQEGALPRFVGSPRSVSCSGCCELLLESEIVTAVLSLRAFVAAVMSVVQRAVCHRDYLANLA